MSRNNKKLHKAGKAKKDEFYTDYDVIQSELNYYEDKFEGKTVLCNCDDPFESNFVKFFLRNFNYLKLKRLIGTSYAGSPVTDTQLSLFDDYNEPVSSQHGYILDITNVPMSNGRGVSDADITALLHQKDVVKRLKGNGDYASDECLSYLKQSDIVVTNPPFSKFRSYLARLIEYDKKFLIIGNVNAITYKEVFSLIQHKQLWLGASIHSGDCEFRVPDDYPLKASGTRVDDEGHKYIRVNGVRWFTNLDYERHYEDLTLHKHYLPNEYPKYDNYDGINVDKTADIPLDYDGIMGVPITFLDKYNPDQFEILGLSGKVGYGLCSNKFYDDYKEAKHDGSYTGASGKKTNGNPVLQGMPKRSHYFINKSGRTVYSLYARIFIKNKHPEDY